jgi:putative MATE family efflux protein
MKALNKKASQKSYALKLTEGPIFNKIVLFTVPVMLTNLLQLLFNTADIVVVGRFSGSDALAAVGATSTLTGLMVNLFIGVSVGANVLAARYYGGDNKVELHDTVHSAVLTAVVGGCIMVVIGELTARPVLLLLGTPQDILAQAVLYLRIYYIGMPFLFIFNFESAILRAVGDTRHPLYILVAAGILNVLCNLFFVIVYGMGIAGVATATVLSEGISALMTTLCLIKGEDGYRLDLRQLKFYKGKVPAMLKIGIPAAVQTTTMTLSTLLVQSSVNSFGTSILAGHTASSNIDSFMYTPLYSFSQTAISFAGQNIGAGKYSRVRKTNRICFAIVLVLGTFMGSLAYIFAPYLIGIYTTDETAIVHGVMRTRLLGFFYGFCGLMEVIPQTVRGMGSSLIPSVIAVVTVCLLRILWIFVVFKIYPDYRVLNISFPAAWIAAVIIQGIYYLHVARGLPKQDVESAE